MMAGMTTPAQWAERVGASERTVRRWLADGLVAGATQSPSGLWDIPADAPRPMVSTAREVSAPPRPAAAALPVNLGYLVELDTLADAWGTSPHQARELVDLHPYMTLTRRGPGGTLRVFYFDPR